MELNIRPWTKEGIEERESQQDLPKNDSGSEEGDEEAKKKHEEGKQEDTKCEEAKQQADEKEYEYEAVGVVVHSGGAEGGHYYSYIKDREKGKWYEFNDTQVKPFDIKDLADETFGGESKGGNIMGGGNDFIGEATYSRSKNAYFIIYQRKYPQPYKTVKLSDSDRDYVKGIPKSVYQHIWDENMLFMKRMYFFDSEYLHFIREFLSLNNFERKLYTENSSYTKALKLKREAADHLGLTKESIRKQEPIQSIDIFDNKESLEVEKSNEEMEANLDFDPDKDVKEEKKHGESPLDEDIVKDRILVDIRNIDKDKLEKAKQLILDSEMPKNSVENIDKLEEDLRSNPALYIIKFSTMFALKIKEQVKDSFSFISLLQQLNSMYEMHADGCMWLLKYLMYNKQMIIEHLLKNKSEEERENFRALLITVLSLVAKNEEKDFFEGESDEYMTEIIAEYDQERDLFFAKEIPKSVLIRFMQVFFEEMLEDSRDHFKTYDDYFLVLFYFARLGFMETKYFVKAKGIHKLLDFIMNNNPPFHHDRKRKKMGSAMTSPNFAAPIDLLSHLIRSCVTKGITETETYSTVSLIHSQDKHISMPYDEIKFITTRLCFTMELLNNQYNEAILMIVLHLCWGDRSNTRFFLEELMFSANIQKSNMKPLLRRLHILSAIMQLTDNLQEKRIEMICNLEDQKDLPPGIPRLINVDEKCLLAMAKIHKDDYPLFTLEVVKVISDLCQNAKMVLYLTKHRDKIIWIRDFLDDMRENLPLTFHAIKCSTDTDLEECLEKVGSCIESLTQVFPEGGHGFRVKKQGEPKSDHQEEDNQENDKEMTVRTDSDPLMPSEPKGVDFQGADDDFMNVASAPKDQPADALMSEEAQKRGEPVNNVDAGNTEDKASG